MFPFRLADDFAGDAVVSPDKTAVTEYFPNHLDVDSLQVAGEVDSTAQNIRRRAAGDRYGLSNDEVVSFKEVLDQPGTPSPALFAP